jgi:hypothetical protein
MSANTRISPSASMRRGDLRNRAVDHEVLVREEAATLAEELESKIG